MWPSKMHAEQLIAEARNLGGLIGGVGRDLDPSLTADWRSSTLKFGAYNSLDYRTGGFSFQQRLKVAERQGMTLREFEKRLL